MLGISAHENIFEPAIKTEVKVENSEPAEIITCQLTQVSEHIEPLNVTKNDAATEETSFVKIDEAKVEPKVLNERQQAMAELKQETENSRLNRLNYLLEKSTLYSQFLTQKLEKEQQEKREQILEEKIQKEGNDSATPRRSNRGRKRKNTKSDQSFDNVGDNDLTKRRKGDDGKETFTGKAGFQNGGNQNISSRQPSLVTGGIMKEYQLVGLEWLVSLYENGLNGILADEMGLGKTLQTISFFAYLRERNVWGPFLVVAPMSTLSNWVNEFNRFTPSVPVILYHGTIDERAEMRKKRMSKLGETFPVIVTSYEIVMNDRKFLQKYAWKYLVIDEGHRIKNMNCKLVQELKSYHSANRLLLTGTP
ncbi:putative ATPase, partial [Basidiobolus ranarum]